MKDEAGDHAGMSYRSHEAGVVAPQKLGKCPLEKGRLPIVTGLGIVACFPAGFRREDSPSCRDGRVCQPLGLGPQIASIDEVAVPVGA